VICVLSRPQFDFGLWTLDFGLCGSQSPTPARTQPLAYRSALSIQPQNLDSSKISFFGIPGDPDNELSGPPDERNPCLAKGVIA